MLSREAFDRYDRQVRNLAASASDYVSRMVSAYMGQHPDASVAECREFARDAMEQAVRVYGDASATAAADYYDSTMADAGNGAPRATLANDVDLGQIERVARYQAGKLVSGDAAGFSRMCGEYAADSVRRAANETTLSNARRDGGRGVRFARVPSGAETCTFCRMLASRGFVYRNEKTAGQFSHFHRNCDCRIVASTDADGLDGYDPDREYRLWKEFEEIDNSQHADGTPLSGEEKDALKRQALADVGPARDEPSFAELLSKTGMTERELLRDWSEDGFADVRASQIRGEPSAKALAIEAYIAEGEKFEGAVYRGVNVGRRRLSAMTRPGAVVRQRGTSSWTSDMARAAEFARYRGDGAEVVFVCEGSTRGVDVSRYSAFPDEAEVIMSERDAWRVVRFERRDGVTYIYLEEA